MLNFLIGYAVASINSDASNTITGRSTGLNTDEWTAFWIVIALSIPVGMVVLHFFDKMLEKDKKNVSR